MLIHAMKVFARRDENQLRVNVYTYNEVQEINVDQIFNRKGLLDDYFHEISEGRTLCESEGTKAGGNLCYAWIDLAIDETIDLPGSLRSIRDLENPTDISTFPYRIRFDHGCLEFNCQRSVKGPELGSVFHELVDSILSQLFIGKGLLQ